MNNYLIALSGIDGAGKSTQLDLIKKNLESNNQKVISLWTRGGNTPGINLAKNFLRKIAGKKLPASGRSSKRDEMLGNFWIQRLWLTLAIIDLMRIYGINIRLFLFTGNFVVCDRYLWDTLIDFKIMFPKIQIENWFIWKLLVWVSQVPKKSVLLIIPEKISEERCAKKYEPFPDTPKRRATRFRLYKNASKNGYWDVIDATKSVNQVFTAIFKN